MPNNIIHRQARIVGPYRYWLMRQWGKVSPWMTFVMLNPSTADAIVDDPTIRRCMGFAHREGYGNMYVFNLFAFRATNPDDLEDAGASGIDVVGPSNEALLYDELMGCSNKVVCAWGAHPLAVEGGRKFVDMAASNQTPLFCLGTTKSGAPRHPLYIKGDQPLVPYP